MGYVKSGDKIADPFGGVGLGAFYSAMNGIAWVGCELEPLFHVSGHRNFEKWIDKFWCACGWEDYLATLRDWLISKDDPKPVDDTPQVSMFDLIEPPQLDSATLWARLIELVQLQRIEAINRRSVEGQFCVGCGKVIAPYPVLLQGDSRFLSSILSQVGAVVSSPPFGEQKQFSDTRHSQSMKNDPGFVAGQSTFTDYGQSPGQLGSMPAGEYDAIISSPVYGGTSIRNNANYSEDKLEDAKSKGKTASRATWGNNAGSSGQDGYGDSDSQLANLPDTGYDMAISSPPFADNPQGWDKLAGNKDGQIRANPRHDGEKLYFTDYAKQDSEGNLGNLPTGEYDAVISSSPFVSSLGSDNPDKRGGLFRDDKRRNDANLTGTYGDGEANLGTMAEGEYDAIITSPPFLDNNVNIGAVGDTPGMRQQIHNSTKRDESYGSTPNQLGNLPPGDFDMTISSPSWAGNSGGQGDASRNAIDPGLFDRHQGGMKRGTGDGEPGNIDHMSEGDYSAVIGSPPFESVSRGDISELSKKWNENPDNVNKPGFRPNQTKDYTRPSFNGDYGQTPNQLGNQSGVTFWATSKDILLETNKVLRKGGYTFWVVKRYIKAGKVIDFPDMWKRLCEVCGFEHVETIHAWQTEDKGTNFDFEGEAKKKVISRKSFFRQIYEKKYPENSIDFETVLILRKL